MDNIVLVQIIDSVQNLLDGLRRVLLRKFALLADPVEQLPSGRELCDDVVLVLEQGEGSISLTACIGAAEKRSR
jgi:hypothetical protein